MNTETPRSDAQKVYKGNNRFLWGFFGMILMIGGALGYAIPSANTLNDIFNA